MYFSHNCMRVNDVLYSKPGCHLSGLSAAAYYMNQAPLGRGGLSFVRFLIPGFSLTLLNFLLAKVKDASGRIGIYFLWQLD